MPGRLVWKGGLECMSPVGRGSYNKLERYWMYNYIGVTMSQLTIWNIFEVCLKRYTWSGRSIKLACYAFFEGTQKSMGFHAWTASHLPLASGLTLIERSF